MKINNSTLNTLALGVWLAWRQRKNQAMCKTMSFDIVNKKVLIEFCKETTRNLGETGSDLKTGYRGIRKRNF